MHQKADENSMNLCQFIPTRYEKQRMSLADEPIRLMDMKGWM